MSSEAADTVPVIAVVSKYRNVLLILKVREPRPEVAVYDIAWDWLVVGADTTLLPFCLAVEKFVED
jgi:hypothetical protein